MNFTAIHHALHETDLKGTPRMAFLVMALHADHRGRVQIGLRDLARMCGVSPQAASDAEKALRGEGLTQVVEGGAGSAPSVYQLLPDQPGRARAASKPAQEPRPQTENPPDAAPPTPPGVKATPPDDPPPSVKLDATLRQPPDNVEAHSLVQQPSIPPWAPQSNVGRVLVAARAQPHPDQPLYWHRREHSADLDALCIAAQVSVDQLCAALSKIEPQPHMRRMRDLAEALRKGAKG